MTEEIDHRNLDGVRFTQQECSKTPVPRGTEFLLQFFGLSLPLPLFPHQQAAALSLLLFLYLSLLPSPYLSLHFLALPSLHLPEIWQSRVARLTDWHGH